MKELSFQQCPSDQCLFFKWGERSLLILATYVDDSIIFGKKEDINDFFESIELFKIKHEVQCASYKKKSQEGKQTDISSSGR